MEALWDKDGRHVGWWDRDGTGAVYDSGAQQHLGFVVNGGAFSADGQPRGHFDHGFVTDDQGNAVAFVDGATGGPSLPYTGGSPYVSSPPYVNVPYLSGGGWAPPLSMTWSDQRLDFLLR